jgi:tetratricopeptide (TPR) repeat protein
MGALLRTRGSIAVLVGVLTVASAASVSGQTSRNDAQEQQFKQLVSEAIDRRRARDYRGSIATLNRALSLARATNSPERQLEALGFLALSYRELPDLQQVLTLRLQILSIIRANPKIFGSEAKSEEPWALQGLAGAYFLLKDLPRAIQYAREAVELEARRISRLKSPVPGFDSVGIGRMRQMLGQFLFLSGEFAASEKVLRQAFEDFEARIRLTETAGMVSIETYGLQLGVLRWLQRACVEAGRIEEALEIAERSRLRNFMTIRPAGSAAMAPRATTVAEMKALARSYRTTIVAYTVTYELDPDLLLEFSDFVETRADGIFIWVLRPDGATAFRRVDLTPLDQSLADLVADARFSIGARGRSASRTGDAVRIEAATAPSLFPTLQALHRVLIEPIEDMLPGTADARVMFVPQDILFLVPFAALQDRAGTFLVSKHALFTNQSVGALPLQSELLRRSAGTARGVLVVGNPKMPGFADNSSQRVVPLPQLPQAEKEATDIAALFASEALVGVSASKKAVEDRIPSARIVHFATHGIMDRDPERSQYFNALALSPTGDDPGFLTPREIDRLRLSAELVVLSACDSAEGRATGDSVLGFWSAFLGAGVPSIVVAQFSIPDAPTATLMREFYAALLRGDDKPRALQQAMLATSKSHPYPGNWAGFVLIGEPSNGEGLTAVRGNSPAIARGSAANDAIPLPEGITNFREMERDPQSVFFISGLSINELLAFYRAAYAKKGFKEETALTQVDTTGASMTLAGVDSLHLIVQITATDGLPGKHVVSVRFEPRR